MTMTDIPARPTPADRPGVVPLRPLMVGEILDGSVTAMRTHPGVMLGLSAIVVTVGQAVAIPLDYLYLRFLSGFVDSSTTTAAGKNLNTLSGLRPGLAVNLITGTLLTGLLIVTVSRAVLGRPITLAEVWRLARPKLPRLLGLTLLIYLMLFGAVAVCVAPGVLVLATGGNSAGSSALGVLLVFLGVIAGGLFAVNRWVAWTLSGAVLMLEDQPIRAAIRRSSLLVKGSWWRVLGIALLALLVADLTAGILVGAQQFFGAKLSPVTDNGDGTYSAHQVTWLAVVVDGAFTTVVQALTAPFVAGVTALQYVDRRMRREALDIQLARSVAADGRRTAS